MNRKTFDLIFLVAVLSHPAIGLVKMASRRWSRELTGPLSTIGSAVEVSL